jgi:hypothetical protein
MSGYGRDEYDQQGGGYGGGDGYGGRNQRQGGENQSYYEGGGGGNQSYDVEYVISREHLQRVILHVLTSMLNLVI